MAHQFVKPDGNMGPDLYIVVGKKVAKVAVIQNVTDLRGGFHGNAIITHSPPLAAVEDFDPALQMRQAIRKTDISFTGWLDAHVVANIRIIAVRQDLTRQVKEDVKEIMTPTVQFFTGKATWWERSDRISTLALGLGKGTGVQVHGVTAPLGDVHNVHLMVQTVDVKESIHRREEAWNGCKVVGKDLHAQRHIDWLTFHSSTMEA